jgi:hypothetical protein
MNPDQVLFGLALLSSCAVLLFTLVVLLVWLGVTGIRKRALPPSYQRTFACVVVAIELGCVAFAVYRLRRADPFRQRSFTPENWRTAGLLKSPGGPVCGRGQMAQDLIDRRLRRGTSREVVVQLLGEPDAIRPNSGDFRLEEPELHRALEVYEYSLGYCSGFQMDGDYLAIAFDAQGRVLDSWHWQS